MLFGGVLQPELQSHTSLHSLSAVCHACRYFSARDPSLVNGSSCIGVATASTPAGPFNSSSSEALTCNEAMGGMIDPSPFVDTDGSVHLLYKVGSVIERLHLLSRLVASGDSTVAHELACTMGSVPGVCTACPKQC